MYGLAQGTYKDFTEVPLWRVEGEDGGGIIRGGDDDRDEQERADAAAGDEDVDAAENAQPQPGNAKRAIKENDDMKALRRKC